MTVCFDGGGDHCMYHVAVGVVMCDGFLLWRLPYAPSCSEDASERFMRVCTPSPPIGQMGAVTLPDWVGMGPNPALMKRLA